MGSEAVDVGEFCRQTRVMIVAGKGGVGKTTVSAVLARLAARQGITCLVVALDRDSDLAARFGLPGPLSWDDAVLVRANGPGAVVRGRAVTPDDALVEYLEGHGLGRLSRRLSASGTLDVIATAVPGLKDVLVLGKVKQLERAAAAGLPDAPELIVVDAPAAGHAITFLTSAQGLADAASGGPIRTQAEEVVELLSDPHRCQVLLVTVAEETPVNEVVDTAYQLEDRVGVQLAPVVVNSVLPLRSLGCDAATAAQVAGVSLVPAEAAALDAAAAFRRHRQALQDGQRERLRRALPLPQLPLPYLFRTELGLAEVDILADALAEEVARLAPGPS
jgi:anion-transporting  ArsA/GET3 family ATPase